MRTVNLNLLPVLRELLRYRNVTRAAEELNLTQSAVSNCLRKLRDHFEDELLIKDGRELRLTEKAKALIDPIDGALSSFQQIFTHAQFSPAASTKRFCVATADYVAAITTPNLAKRLPLEAPNISVQMITGRRDSNAELRLGAIDLIIAPQRIADAAMLRIQNGETEFRSEILLNDELVCIGPAHDSALKKGLSVEDYLARNHVSFYLDRDYHASMEHLHFDQNQIDQFNQILVADFTLLPMIVAESDSLALIPASLFGLLKKSYAIQQVDVPLSLPALDLVMVWSRESDQDDANIWLRTILKECVAPFQRP